jgi:eukaryotic-like serine/threonine-protein kinase
MKNRPFHLLIMTSMMIILILACSVGPVDISSSSELPEETLPKEEGTISESILQDEATIVEETPNTETDEESSLGVGSTLINPTDDAEMVYVPEGEFLMGSEDGMYDEKPEHMVYLDAFWIYKFEVTNMQFKKCIEAGICSDSSLFSYGDNSFPACVNWFQAKDYCEWIGGRLPTEAEWEKAARGIDGRDYPWGNENPTCDFANFVNCVGGPQPVGSYPDGASPYGALDMIGNVSEWVADWWAEDYYGDSPYKNPLGPIYGKYRVLRGGDFLDGFLDGPARAWSRENLFIEQEDSPGGNTGIRCVRDETP